MRAAAMVKFHRGSTGTSGGCLLDENKAFKRQNSPRDLETPHDLLKHIQQLQTTSGGGCFPF